MTENAPPAKPHSGKAGNRDFFSSPLNVAKVNAGPAYTTASGHVVESQRMMVGLMRLAAGEVTETHKHENEQWTCLTEGALYAKIGGSRWPRWT